VSSSRFIPAAVLPLVMLTACASLPEDRGLGDVHGLVADRTALQLPAPAGNPPDYLPELLAQPLTAAGAVQVALVNNPRLRAEYARMGIAAADVYDAGRLSNPRLGVSVMYSDEHSTANQVSIGLTQNFSDLLLLSARSRLAQAEFERLKLEVSAVVVDFAADTAAAYYQLVGAQQLATMRANVAQAAEVSAALAQRFYDAGNISALELALQQSEASYAKLEAMRAAADAVAARNALNRLLGLKAGDSRWTTTGQLSLPVTTEDDLDGLITLAWQSRLDLAAKRAQVAWLADSLGVTRQYRYLGDSEIGIETERETDRSRITGPNLSIELPLFNSGAGRVARAESLVDQAEAELQTLALDIGNDVELAYTQVQASRQLFEQYRTALVPQREAIVQQTQREVSYMLQGQFELLSVKQQEFNAYQGYLESLRDYWIARTSLARAVGAQLPSDRGIADAGIGPSLPTAAPESPMEHTHHPIDHSQHGKGASQ